MPTPPPSAPRLAALSCRMRGRRVYLEITDRRTISFPVTKYARLAYAPQIELEKIHLLDEGRAIRWETLDEVIQVEDVARLHYVPSPEVSTAHRANGPH